MNYKIVEADIHEECGVCGDPFNCGLAFFDEELDTIVCPDCRYNSLLAHGYLHLAGIRECTKEKRD